MLLWILTINHHPHFSAEPELGSSSHFASLTGSGQELL